MIIRERIPLRTLTTFRIGGPARYVAECSTIKDIETAVAFAREHDLALMPLGEGSNVLAPDEGYDGMILRYLASDIREIEEGDTVRITVDAGCRWDTLVDYAVERGLWGIENLAGIPGTTGAAPVQNIGAYGCEVSDVLVAVEVYDVREERVYLMPAEACALGYRESRFKREPHLIITRVTLRLGKNGAPQIRYKDIEARRAAGESLATPKEIARTVRDIRSKKFPDLTKEGTAGSFFKNPVIAHDAYETLQKRYPELPGFETAQGIKVPLAYVLDQILSLRGYRMHTVRLFEAQPLVLVAEENATRADVDALANDVAARVHEATNIAIEREVRSI